MTSIATSVGTHQTSPQEVPSPPAWLGELTVIAHFLQQQGVLAAIAERVRFARRRGWRAMKSSILSRCRSRYAIGGERTLEAFYQHVQPFATAFMALFGRERLPARSTLSRFLAHDFAQRDVAQQYIGLRAFFMALLFPEGRGISQPLPGTSECIE